MPSEEISSRSMDISSRSMVLRLMCCHILLDLGSKNRTPGQIIDARRGDQFAVDRYQFALDGIKTDALSHIARFGIEE